MFLTLAHKLFNIIVKPRINFKTYLSFMYLIQDNLKVYASWLLRYSEILYWTLDVSWTASYELTLVLTLWVPEELKNSIFEMPIITQTLIINNLRTTSAKSVNLNFIRKLVEYSFKNVLAKAMFILTVFEILPQRSTGSERINQNWRTWFVHNFSFSVLLCPQN